MDERAALLLLSDAVGTLFGTEDFCLFLYSLVRMQMPKIIVELGTGLGLSAFSMALAAKRNEAGHVWTVDNMDCFATYRAIVTEICGRLHQSGLISTDHPSAGLYFEEITSLLGLEQHLTFVKSQMLLNEAGHFDHYPFAGKPIDLLFSDFQHDPKAILKILGHFLPKMSLSCSIFIDSASTYWPSYLLLEQLCSQWNQGKVPKALQDLCSEDLSDLVRSRRMLVVHLTERKQRAQNSTAWLKIEPIDVLPHPATIMRGAQREKGANGSNGS